MTPSHKSAAPDRAAALVRPEIAALAGYVPGEQPQGGEWIKLNTNENPYAPSPEVATAVTALLAGRTLGPHGTRSCVIRCAKGAVRDNP